MTIKIGVLTHSRKDQYTFKELEKQLDVTFLCKVGVLDYAVPVAVSLEKMNAEALIATSATAAHIKNHVGIPVIPLYVRNENLLDALLRAKQMGGAIAFADINKHVLYDIDRLADLLECDIKRYPFNHLDETEQVVADALGEGRQVMVTQADCMASCASRNGLPSVIVPITRQDIVDAVEHAKILISLHNKQMEKISWLTAVIDNYPEGVSSPTASERSPCSTTRCCPPSP